MEFLNLLKNKKEIVKEFEVKLGFFGTILSHDKKFYDMVKGEFKLLEAVHHVNINTVVYKITLDETVYDIETTIKLMATGLDLEVNFI